MKRETQQRSILPKPIKVINVKTILIKVKRIQTEESGANNDKEKIFEVP